MQDSIAGFDFLVGDPVAIVEIPKDQGYHSTLILRDIEMQRAKQSARADAVACPKDFAPEGGLQEIAKRPQPNRWRKSSAGAA